MDATPHRSKDIRLVRWPAEADRRARYRAMGVLRLLVVEGGVPAPICSDIREDWVRAPISKEDLWARLENLRARAGAHGMPQVDPYGILRLAGRSVTLSRTETDLLDVLIDRFGCLVSHDTLHQWLPGRQGVASRNALNLHIMRIRRRIKPLGLVIRTVRGRGYLIEAITPLSSADPGRRGAEVPIARTA